MTESKTFETTEKMRSCGILLHITSLPSPFGIGDIGPEARNFVDTLAACGQTWWQILPMCPVGLGHSPYASPASFAGNPLLISPELMVEDGWVTESEIHSPYLDGRGPVNYTIVRDYKSQILLLGYSRFKEQPKTDAFLSFVEQEKDWLLPYAIFQKRKTQYRHQIWTSWPEAHRRANHESIHLDDPEIQFFLFEQFVFDQQWNQLREYCTQKGIKIMGDLPIYVAHDSVDVWANPELFQLDSTGDPLVVAGVPPDFFSPTGQRWGNPIYRWDIMQQQGYDWWIRRMKRALKLCDCVRLDHFRGFAGYWEIPASEETAVHGRWVSGPGQALFDRLTEELDSLHIIAEDLGVITDDVTELMENNAFPGMAVLQFGFDSGMDNFHLPHHYKPNQCVYTGTHDNDTLFGWWKSHSEYEHHFARDYLDIQSDQDVCPKAIERCMHSEAGMVIVPVQDVLSLDTQARMNFPGTAFGNWEWSLSFEQHIKLRESYATWLHRLAVQTGRFTAEN